MEITKIAILVYTKTSMNISLRVHDFCIISFRVTFFFFFLYFRVVHSYFLHFLRKNRHPDCNLFNNTENKRINCSTIMYYLLLRFNVMYDYIIMILPCIVFNNFKSFLRIRFRLNREMLILITRTFISYVTIINI